MAECKACGKRGLFLSLNPDSLCGECAGHVPRDIARRAQIAKESMALVEKTTNLDTMLSRLDLATEQMSVLWGTSNAEFPRPHHRRRGS